MYSTLGNTDMASLTSDVLLHIFILTSSHHMEKTEADPKASVSEK